MITDYSPDMLDPGDVLLPDSKVPCGHPALATIEEINTTARRQPFSPPPVKLIATNERPPHPA